ncbi:uncharacterized protein SCHCODRAFT_02616283 [Schizophyllum commune H4-8]|nr:uncharacterized protein SCHCODRAFT_02616283 [Schizophyllum commune H4-8]KAI5896947.1 hypothetical protein SCHCODRAFT_02616283 [Schizophyllum commune H4-8]
MAASLSDVQIARETPSDGLQEDSIQLVAKHPQHGLIGKLQALIFSRSPALQAFLKENSHQWADFVLRIFDPNMNVNPMIVGDPHHSGTGCWGNEMSVGPIVLLHDLEIVTEFANKGVEYALLKELLSLSIMTLDTIVYSGDVARPQARPYLRVFGFRRVGRTAIFAYSPNHAHPSRSVPLSAEIAIDQDRFAPKPWAFPPAVMAALRQRFPVQTAADPPFDRTLAMAPAHMQPHVPTPAEVVAVVHDAYARHPAFIHVQDDQGFTPVYAAAIGGAVPALRALLEYGIPAEEILSRDHNGEEHMNAIEAFDRAMMDKRLETQIWERRKTTYSDEELMVSYMLRQAAGQEVPSLEKFMSDAQRVHY